MTRKQTKKRPAETDPPAAFQRFQKLTKALLGVSKEELDQKRAEYERQIHESHQRKEPRSS